MHEAVTPGGHVACTWQCEIRLHTSNALITDLFKKSTKGHHDAFAHVEPLSSQQLILSYLQLDIKYFDLGLEYRDAVRRYPSSSMCSHMLTMTWSGLCYLYLRPDPYP